jgi:hypothetical protein
MKLVVSPANPTGRVSILGALFCYDHVPISFRPFVNQMFSLQANANIRARESSERVCIKILRLMDLSKATSVAQSTIALKQAGNVDFPSGALSLRQTVI